MNGEIFLDMTREDRPILNESKYLLKRWRKHTIYAKSGSYNRGNNPRDGLYPVSDGMTDVWTVFTDTSENLKTDLYTTCSVYLYDYVVVSKDFFNSIVYTEVTVDTTPAGYEAEVGTDKWTHLPNTFKNSPNAIINNYQLQYNKDASNVVPLRPRYGYCPLWSSFNPDNIIIDDGTYFEIVRGYPRNHYTHKRHLFSLYITKTYGMVNKTITFGSYVRNRQTISTTIGTNGLEDGSLPVQLTQVGNLNLIQTDNVINH